MIDYDNAPTLAECQREAAEEMCATHGHVIGTDEDGNVVCERCCVQALDHEEEPPQLQCKHFAGPECEDCR